MIEILYFSRRVDEKNELKEFKQLQILLFFTPPPRSSNVIHEALLL